MEENSTFLKFIYHEDLFILEEPEMLPDVDNKELNDSRSLSEKTAPSMVKGTERVTFFGHNEKKILILIYEPESLIPKQHELNFLMKIIESGLKYSKNDFALANTAKFPVDQVLNEIPYKFLISFGEANGPLSDDIPLYQVLETADKKELFAENLSMIDADESKKRQLWKALKTMFDL